MPSLSRGLFDDEFGGTAGAGGANQHAAACCAVSGEKSSLGARTSAAASNAANDAESSACDASAGLRALPGAAAPAPPPAHASAAAVDDRPPDKNVCRKAMRCRIDPVAPPPARAVVDENAVVEENAADDENAAADAPAVVDALTPTPPPDMSSSKRRPPIPAGIGAASPFDGAAPPKFKSEPKMPRFFAPAPSSTREMGLWRESDGDVHLR